MKYILLFFALSIYAFPLQLLSQDESWKVYDDSEVAIIRITMDNDDLNYMYANVESDSLHPCVMIFQNAEINDTVSNVAIRLRGNTSRTSFKKSFKISFNSFTEGEKFYSLEKLNLNGEHNDPTTMRGKLSWDLYKVMNMISSRSAHAEVYINEEYYGLYISVEHIDEEFLKKNFNDDSGNLWKCLHPANLVYLGDDHNFYKAEANDRRIYDLKTNKSADDYSEIAHFIDVINNLDDSLFYDSLLAVINIEDLLKYYAFDILSGSWDDMWFGWNNFYLYFNTSEKKFRIIPYDYDNTFGIDFGTYDDWATRNIYNWVNTAEQPSILSERILINSKLRNLFTHFLEYYANEVFQLNLWESRADSLKEMITTSAELDPYKSWGFTNIDFHQAYDSTGYYFHESLKIRRSIKEFVNVRVSSVIDQLDYNDSDPIIYKASASNNVFFDQDSISIKASIFSPNGIKSAKVILESSGIIIDTFSMVFDPILDDNEISKADRWKIKFFPAGNWELGDLKIVAEDNNGNTSIYQNSDLHIKRILKKSTNIFLNEIMASNANSIMDEQGEHEDWIEILNFNEEEIDIGGYYLTDDKRNLTKWQIPDSTFIEPKTHILFWCDNEVGQGSMHANFKLKSSGEFLAIVDPDGYTIVDSLQYPSLNSDVSYGRNLASDSLWHYFVFPTPNKSNYIVPVDPSQKIMINEIMSQNTSTYQDNSGEFNDWVELFNNNNFKIDLSGKFLTDSKTYLGKWKFPDSTIIHPNGYLIVWCDNDSSDNELQSNFNLSSNGEFLAIVDNDAVSYVDSVNFPSLEENFSFARITEGDFTWFISETPTPGFGNIITSTSEIIPTEFKNSISAYPNPFNPSTIIEYEIAKPMSVEFSIYDILGREVWRSEKVKKESGKYQLTWNGIDENGRELSSGIYLFNLVGDSFNKAIKLMIVR